MSQIDSTEAFNADVEREETADQLRERLRKLEQEEEQNAAPGSTADSSDEEQQDPFKRTADAHGFTFRFRVPSENAATALSIAASANNELSMKYMQKFLANYLHPEDYEKYLDIAMSPDSGMPENFIVDILTALMKDATNR